MHFKQVGGSHPQEAFHRNRTSTSLIHVKTN